MPLLTCKTCEGKVSSQAEYCPHCGHPAHQQDGVVVRVRDIDIKFGSMVSLMVKSAIAAIPAIIILAVVGAFIFGILAGISRA